MHQTLEKQILIALAILAASGLAFWLLQETKPDKSVIEQRENIPKVNVELLERTAASPQVQVVGQVVSQEVTPLLSPAELFVDKTNVAVGDLVQKDAILIELNQQELLLRQTQLQADVDTLKAELANAELAHKYNQTALANERKLVDIAKRNVNRAKKLAQSQSGSQAALDSAVQGLQQQSLALQQRQQLIDAFEITKQRLQAQINKAQASLDLVNIDIARSQVRAPFNGYVTALHVSTGQRVSPNMRLLEMYRQGSLELKVQIPARYADAIRLARNNVNIPQTTAVSSQGKTFVFHRIAANIAQNQAGVDVYFRATNAIEEQDELRLGETLDVTLNLPEIQDVITVPFDALYDSNRIYLVKENVLQGYQVERLGEYVDNQGKQRVIIKNAQLKPNQQVLVSRLPQALSGEKVNPNIVNQDNAK